MKRENLDIVKWSEVAALLGGTFITEGRDYYGLITVGPDACKALGVPYLIYEVQIDQGQKCIIRGQRIVTNGEKWNCQGSAGMNQTKEAETLARDIRSRLQAGVIEQVLKTEASNAEYYRSKARHEAIILQLKEALGCPGAFDNSHGYEFQKKEHARLGVVWGITVYRERVTVELDFHDDPEMAADVLSTLVKLEPKKLS